jgi:DNA-binding beta-propeller fold protein YncE
MTRAAAAIAIAILFVVPIPQSGPSTVSIAYGRSWPRSIVLDSGRQLGYVDGMSGIYPPDGFSFGVISLANESIRNVVGLPGIAGELALDASSGTVYAAGANSVSVFDVRNMTFVRTIALKIPIFSIAFDSTTGNLLVTSDNSVFQLDPGSGRLLRNVTVGDSAEGMAVDSASGIVFVANYLSSSVSVLRTADLAEIKTVELPLPSYPSQLALDASRGVIYVTTDGQPVVEVSSTNYNVVGSINVSQSSANGTYALAVDPVRERLFVASEPGTTISELNSSTGALLSTFAVDSAAYEMAVDQTTGKLYVTNYHQITVVTPVDVPQPAPQPPQYGAWAVLAGGLLALAACLYVWRFTATGGKRDGPAPQRQKDLAS